MQPTEYFKQLHEEGNLMNVQERLWIASRSHIGAVARLVEMTLTCQGEVLDIDRRTRAVDGVRYAYRTVFYVTVLLPLEVTRDLDFPF